MEAFKEMLELVKDMGAIGAWLYVAYLVAGLVKVLGSVGLVFYGINTIIGRVFINGKEDK